MPIDSDSMHHVTRVPRTVHQTVISRALTFVPGCPVKFMSAIRSGPPHLMAIVHPIYAGDSLVCSRSWPTICLPSYAFSTVDLFLRSDSQDSISIPAIDQTPLRVGFFCHVFSPSITMPIHDRMVCMVFLLKPSFTWSSTIFFTAYIHSATVA